MRREPERVSGGVESVARALGLKSGHIETNGIRLHFMEAGTGPLMLMVHGFPEFWYSWRHQLGEFAKDHRVVAIDLRGYNLSDRPKRRGAYVMDELLKDLDGVITGLGHEKCTLVAHDWGGAIAWTYATEHPGRVEKLVVMSMPHPALFKSHVLKPPQLFKSWYIFFFQLPWLPERFLARNDFRGVSGIFRGSLVDKDALTREELSEFRRAAAQPGALTAMLNYYRNMFRPSSALRRWPKLEMPVLLVWGEKDAALGKELTYGTDRYVRDLTVRYLPDASHWVQQERPAEVNRIMREWLSRRRGTGLEDGKH